MTILRIPLASLAAFVLGAAIAGARGYEADLPGEKIRIHDSGLRALGLPLLRPAADAKDAIPVFTLPEAFFAVAQPVSHLPASRGVSGAPDGPVDEEEPLDELLEPGPDLPPPPPPTTAATPDPTGSPAPPAPDERCPCEGPHQEPYRPSDGGLCFTHQNGCGGARSCACGGNSLADAAAVHNGALVDQGGRTLCQKHAQQGCP